MWTRSNGKPRSAKGLVVHNKLISKQPKATAIKLEKHKETWPCLVDAVFYSNELFREADVRGKIDNYEYHCAKVRDMVEAYTRKMWPHLLKPLVHNIRFAFTGSDTFHAYFLSSLCDVLFCYECKVDADGLHILNVTVGGTAKRMTEFQSTEAGSAARDACAARRAKQMKPTNWDLVKQACGKEPIPTLRKCNTTVLRESAQLQRFKDTLGELDDLAIGDPVPVANPVPVLKKRNEEAVPMLTRQLAIHPPYTTVVGVPLAVVVQ